MSVVKTFSDKSYLEFARGKFDDYCIFYNTETERMAPRDLHYFTFLKDMSKTYGSQKIYEDFVSIYEKTDKNINPEILDYIDSLSLQYGKDSLTINIIFTILYMGMIAEENKAGTVLGKRIKRLGMHFLLIAGTTAEYASNFMRGMRASEIKSICQSCGF